MPYNNNLGIVTPTDSQTNKMATTADALLRLNEALSNAKLCSFAAGDVALTLDDFQRNSILICSGVTAAHSLTFPIGVRWCFVASSAANTASVAVTLGTATYPLPPGATILAITDGTANGLTCVPVAGAVGILDAPSDGVGYVRENGGWVAAPAAGIADVVDATLSLRKNGQWVAYTAPAAGVPEAPNDTGYYLRHQGAWTPYTAPAAGIGEAPTDGALYGRRSGGWAAVPAAATALIIDDEGTQISGTAAALNFVGAGVTVTDGGGGVAVVTIPGATSSGGGSVAIQDEGTAIETAATVLNFVGAGVTVTDAGGVATVAIPGATASAAPPSPLIPSHPPLATTFPYQLLGGAAAVRVSANKRAFTMTRTDAGQTGDTIAFVGKAVPAGTSWTAETIIRIPPQISGYTQRPGFAIFESATGKGLLMYYSNGSLNILQMTGLTAFSGNIFGSASGGAPESEYWLRIRYDGTNYYFDQSVDMGTTWQQRVAAAKSAYFTTAADRIGIAVEVNGAQASASNGMVRVQCLYYSDPDYLSANGYDTQLN